MKSVVTATRFNPFAVKILQIAVEDVLSRTGCRDYAIDPDTGDVEARAVVEGYESRFLFRLRAPCLEVRVTAPHPALTREAARQAAEQLADGVMDFMDDEARICCLLEESRRREEKEV